MVQVNNKSLPLAELFARLEEARVKFKLSDQSISQTTLEQVFLSFAKHQNDSKEDKDKAKAKVVVTAV